MGKEAWTADILGYKEIQVDGVALPRRSILNLIGGNAVDNPVNKSTDVTGTGGGGGGTAAKWLVGSGAPSDLTGANGDMYLDTLSGNVYQKISGSWALQGSILGPPGSAGSGALWRTGNGVPSNGLGANGDLYLNTANGDVYQKSGGTYGSPVANIAGPAGQAGTAGTNGTAGSVWRTGSGAPANTLGVNGDYYLNTANGAVHFKSGNTYSVVANLTGPAGSGTPGPTGAAGTQFRVGTTAPNNAVGVDGDLYLRTTTSEIFQRQSGVYSLVGTLSAATAAINVSLSPTITTPGQGAAATNVQVALQQMGAGKANLAGGNAFTGNQNLSSGSLRVTDSGNISTASGAIYTGPSAPTTGVSLFAHQSAAIGGILEVFGTNTPNAVGMQITNGNFRAVNGRIYTGPTAPTGNVRLATHGDAEVLGGMAVGTGLQVLNGPIIASNAFGHGYIYEDVVSVSRCIDITASFAGTPSAWTNQGGAFVMNTTPAGQARTVGINHALKHGATLSQVRVRINSTTFRSGSNGVSAVLLRRFLDATGATVETVCPQIFVANTGVQNIQLTPSGSHTIDLINYAYILAFSAGIGGSAGDALYSAVAIWTTNNANPF